MSAAGSVVVTGAAGFIGSHVCEALLRRGTSVVGLDNFDPFYDTGRKRANLVEVEATAASAKALFTFAEVDCTDGPGVSRLFAMHRPAGVIHLAAKAGVRPSIADPSGYAHANITGTSVVLAAAERAGCTRVVVASSSSVYGNAEKVPFSEEDDVSRPISPYAATKRACELIGFTHHHLTKMPTAMLRFFTVYGPRQRPDLAISLFMGKISRGESMDVFGQGTSRDYTSIDDIVRGVLASYDAIDRFGYRVWNLGGSKPVELDEMIQTIARVVGTQAKIVRMPMQPGDVTRTFADLSRSRAELGYEPGTSFEEGVARQWEWTKRAGLV